MAKLNVTQEDTLLSFLAQSLPSMSRSALKNKLRYGAVLVDGVVQTQATAPLAAGMVVELSRMGELGGKNPAGIRLLKVASDWVVIDKPVGLLTVASAKERDRTALKKTQELLKGKGTLFACHRLDRETSGLLLMARSKAVQEHFFATWQSVQKVYLVVVEGEMADDRGTVDAPLWEDPQSLSVSVREGPDSKRAVSHFKVLQRQKGRSLVEVTLQTGRKHQIRVHMAHLGHPVVGDARYNPHKKSGGRLALHAHRLSFTPPGDGAERQTFESPMPPEMKRLMGMASKLAPDAGGDKSGDVDDSAPPRKARRRNTPPAKSKKEKAKAKKAKAKKAGSKKAQAKKDKRGASKR